MAIDVESSLPRLEPLAAYREPPRPGPSDSFRFARSLIFILLATALDVTNFLDKGNSIRYALLLIPVGVILAMWLRTRAWRLRRPTRTDWVLFVLFTVGFVGTMWGALHLHTKSGMRPVFFPMAIAFLYLGTLEDPRDREIVSLLRALSWVGVAYAAASVSVHLANYVPLGILVKLAAYRQYKNATLLYLAMGIGATYALRQRWRLAFLLVSAAFIFKAYPSGTAVLVVLGTIFTFYLTGAKRSNVRPYLIAFAGLLAVAIVLLNFSAGVGIASKYFSSVGKRNNNGTRIALWTAGVQEFQQSPVVGRVFSGETVVDTHRAGQAKVFQLPFHNDYILFMVEGGVIGLGLLLLWVAATEFLVLRRQGQYLAQGDHGRAALLRTLLVGFNAFFITAAFNPLVTEMSSSATIFAIYGLIMLVGVPKLTRGPWEPDGDDGHPSFVRWNGTARPRRRPPVRTSRFRSRRPVGVPSTASPPATGPRSTNPVAMLPAPFPAADVETVGVAPPSRPAPPTPQSAGDGSEPADGLTLESVKRKLLRGSAWVFGGRVITVALGLFLNKLLANLMSVPEFGVYSQVLILVFAGSIIAQLGLDRAVVRFVASAIATGQPGQAKSTVKRIWFYVTVSSIVTALIALAAGTYYAQHIATTGGQLLATVMPIAAGWLIVTALQALLVDTFRGFEKFSMSTVFDQLLVDVLSVAIFGALYVTRAAPNLHELVLLSAGFSTVALLVGGALMVRRVRRLSDEGEQLPKGELYAMAWPLLITNFAIYLLGTGIDQFTLGAFRPAVEVGLYAAAAKVMFLVATPYIILQGVTPPLIAEMFAKRKMQEMERTLRMVSTVAGLPAFLALVVFIFYGRQVMSFFFRPEWAAAAGVLAILSAGRLIAVWTGSAGVTLMMTGHQKPLMYTTVFCGIASVGSGLLLAPHFGKTGVAVGTASTQAMQNTLQLLLVRKKLGIWTHAHLSPKPLIAFLRKKPSANRVE